MYIVSSYGEICMKISRKDMLGPVMNFQWKESVPAI